MAARFASRLSHVGGSVLGGLGNISSGSLRTSLDCTWNNFLSQQQQRTFIQMRTVLKVVDNSGAKKVMCIQAKKGKKGARLGDTIVASVKEAHPNGKVKKGEVVYGVVVRAAMQRGRCDGSEDLQHSDGGKMLMLCAAYHGIREVKHRTRNLEMKLSNTSCSPK